MARTSSAGRPAFGSPEKSKFIQRSVYFTEELSVRLDKYCEDEERAFSWAIRKAVDQWLAERGY